MNIRSLDPSYHWARPKEKQKKMDRKGPYQPKIDELDLVGWLRNTHDVLGLNGSLHLHFSPILVQWIDYLQIKVDNVLIVNVANGLEMIWKCEMVRVRSDDQWKGSLRRSGTWSAPPPSPWGCNCRRPLGQTVPRPPQSPWPESHRCPWWQRRRRSERCTCGASEMDQELRR